MPRLARITSRTFVDKHLPVCRPFAANASGIGAHDVNHCPTTITEGLTHFERAPSPVDRMTGRVAGWWVRSRSVRRGALLGAAGAMWYVAGRQLASGVVDVAMFAPPAAVLGLAATWAAHIYSPHRFTWRRGFDGALVSALLFSPLTAATVTFAAAWDPASFLVLFTVGAWVAVASGVAIGAATAMVRWIARVWRRRRGPSARQMRWASREAAPATVHPRWRRHLHPRALQRRRAPCS